LGLAYAGIYWHFLRVGPTYERGGTQFALDLERALVRARLQNKPVLLCFLAVNAVNSRSMEKNVLSASPVAERLQKFVCVAAFVDQIPFIEAKEGMRLAARNDGLQQGWLEDVTIPSFAVVRPEFNPQAAADRYDPLAVSFGAQDEAEFTRFLDAALEKWKESRSASAEHSLRAELKPAG